MPLRLASRVFDLVRQLRSALRVAAARATGVVVGRDCTLGSSTDLLLGAAHARRGQLELGDKCVLEQGVILHPYGGHIRVGRDVYIGQHTVIFGHGGVDIGKDTLIAMHCRILSSEHTLTPLGTIIRSVGDVTKPTRIGADVWLGAGVTVRGGVTIGDGCVVGAGAVVTLDLEPGSIAVGVPATVIGRRSTPTT